MPALWQSPRLYAAFRIMSIVFSGACTSGRNSRRRESIMVSDPIGDFLIRIQNGYRARKRRVLVSYSRMNEVLAKILEREGYIQNSEITDQQSGDSKQQRAKSKKAEATIPREMVVNLKYTDNKPAIERVKRVSTPGRRIYVDKYHLPYVLTGYGRAVISTSKGILTDEEARKQGVGGEVICEIW